MHQNRSINRGKQVSGRRGLDLKNSRERAKLGSSERGGLEALADVFGANMKDPISIPTKECGW